MYLQWVEIRSSLWLFEMFLEMNEVVDCFWLLYFFSSSLPLPPTPRFWAQICNLFENSNSAEWLLYISEWTAPHTTSPLSNIRVTTKVAVTSLLSDRPALQERGTAIIYNLAIKEVKTVVDIQFQFSATLHLPFLFSFFCNGWFDPFHQFGPCCFHLIDWFSHLASKSID